MNSFFQKLRAPLHRPSKEDDRRKELQFHMEQEAENPQGEGLSVEEARFAARQSVAGQSDGTTVRDGGAYEHRDGALSRHLPTAHRKRLAI